MPLFSDLSWPLRNRLPLEDPSISLIKLLKIQRSDWSYFFTFMLLVSFSEETLANSTANFRAKHVARLTKISFHLRKASSEGKARNSSLLILLICDDVWCHFDFLQPPPAKKCALRKLISTFPLPSFGEFST